MKHIKKFNELFDNDDLRNDSEMIPDYEMRDRFGKGEELNDFSNRKESFEKWIINEYPLFDKAQYLVSGAVQIFMFKSPGYFVSVAFENLSSEIYEVTLAYRSDSGENERTEVICNGLKEISKYIDEKVVSLLNRYNFGITKNISLN
jgi:hypothetical protein